MQYSCVLLDLDGTLTDSSAGITRSANYALQSFGIRVEDWQTRLRCFIGPPLPESFQTFYGFSPEKARQATQKYRERYNTVGLYENSLYPGVVDLLEHLREQGRTLLLATGKPTPTTREILDHFQITRYFDVIAGSEFDGTRENKDEVIEYALALAGIKDRSHAVMVGDRRHDVIGAKAAAIPCIGVLYGFGTRPELEQAGADWICSTVADLAAWFDRDI